MKVLLDSCVWGGAASDLRATGHDVLCAADWPKDPGDEQILDRANRDARVLITLDKDFGELAVLRGHPHAGIVRLVGIAATRQGDISRRILHAYADDLAKAAIITVDGDRVRVRMP